MTVSFVVQNACVSALVTATRRTILDMLNSVHTRMIRTIKGQMETTYAARFMGYKLT